jgi:hypothetical protein
VSQPFRSVRAVNQEEMDKLEGPIKCYSPRTHILRSSTSKAGEDLLRTLLQNAGLWKFIPGGSETRDTRQELESLQLKEGAQVMLTFNMDPPQGLVNGARGIIIGYSDTNDQRAKKGESTRPVATFEFQRSGSDMFLYPDESLPIVKFSCGKTLEIPYHKQTLEKDGTEVVLWRMALKLAWATSIHNSQSLTLDAVELDISRCFESGMAYVGLSRLNKLENLRLTKAFKPAVIKVDKEVIDFYNVPFSLQKTRWKLEKRKSPTNHSLGFEIVSDRHPHTLHASSHAILDASSHASSHAILDASVEEKSLEVEVNKLFGL